MASSYPVLGTVPQFEGTLGTALEQFEAARRRPWWPVLLAIAFHILVLVLLLERTKMLQLEKPKIKGEDKVAILYFPQQPETKPVPTIPVTPLQARREPRPAPASKPRTPPPEATASLPKPLPARPDAITAPPVEEDMMARVEAARKRRAEQSLNEAPAQAQAAEEDDNQRALRIARANFAASARPAGMDREDTGGVFQIRNQSFHKAEFTFRGWNTTMRRMWPQSYEVEQGNESDIEMAIIKKMIEVIRKYKDGDFIWDSRRLGRQVTLSARVEDTAQLQQFLLREFFPAYRPAARQ